MFSARLVVFLMVALVVSHSLAPVECNLKESWRKTKEASEKVMVLLNEVKCIVNFAQACVGLKAKVEKCAEKHPEEDTKGHYKKVLKCFRAEVKCDKPDQWTAFLDCSEAALD